MKKNASLIGLIITCAIIGFILVFYNVFLDKKDGFVIDNPSKSTINIKINNENYVVAPHQHTRIKLTKGKTKISYTYNNKDVDTIIDIIKPSGLINPTFQEYYTFTRPYGVRKNKDSIFLSKNITIDNQTYHGIIEKSTDLFIDNFYYNLDQDYPRIFIKSTSSEKKTDLSKIFNKDDFKQFYFENYE